MTVLMWACAQGRRPGALATVKTLVERGGCDVRQRAGDGTSCLMWAATGGSLAVCEYLATRGADPSLPDADGSVPLHWAAGSGAADIVDWLLTAHRADLRTRNAFGCTVAFALNGQQRSITIVGDDEASPPAGLLAFSAPLCRAMMDAEVGDRLDFGGRHEAIEILAIGPPVD